MPSAVKTFFASKRIKVWKKLLVEVDLGVVQELVQGTSLVGEVEQCGLWPSKFSTALITETERLEIGVRQSGERSETNYRQCRMG